MEESQAAFRAKTGEFEGPLDLLLQLIEDKKLHISKVSLAAVTDQFVEHVKTLEQSGGNPTSPRLRGTSKGQLADFILVASTLMFIKSAALLPQLQVTTEEAQSAADLERRLRLYQKFKELAQNVKQQYGQQRIFGREASKEIRPAFTPTHEVTAGGILAAVQSVIKSFPLPEKLTEVIVKKVISLEEVITDLTNRVQTALKLSFKDFVKNKTDRVNIIVSFLGMLELVRQGIVTVEQQAHYQDISIETTKPSDVPRYT